MIRRIGVEMSVSLEVMNLFLIVVSRTWIGIRETGLKNVDSPVGIGKLAKGEAYSRIT